MLRRDSWLEITMVSANVSGLRMIFSGRLGIVSDSTNRTLIESASDISSALANIGAISIVFCNVVKLADWTLSGIKLKLGAE